MLIFLVGVRDINLIYYFTFQTQKKKIKGIVKQLQNEVENLSKVTSEIYVTGRFHRKAVCL